jgi:N-acetyl-anhydromuramyl-L-alanine amidase AmpD
MNLFETLFYERYVGKAILPIPISHMLLWQEALATFPTIDTLQGVSSVSRKTKTVVLVVLHHSGSLDFGKAIKWFRNPNSYSSTNYVIDLDGHILCLVPEERGALHMPNATYNYSRLVDHMSLGVTLVGDGITPFTDSQYEAIAMLCSVWKKKYNLKNEDIKKHADIPHTGEQHYDPSPWDQEKFLTLLSNYDNL